MLLRLERADLLRVGRREEHEEGDRGARVDHFCGLRGGAVGVVSVVSVRAVRVNSACVMKWALMDEAAAVALGGSGGGDFAHGRQPCRVGAVCASARCRDGDNGACEAWVSGRELAVNWSSAGAEVP